MSGLNARFFPTPFPLDTLHGLPARWRAEALQGTSPLAQEVFVTTRPSQHPSKKLLSDYPRGLVNCFRLWWFPVSDPLPITLAFQISKYPKTLL